MKPFYGDLGMVCAMFAFALSLCLYSYFIFLPLCTFELKVG